MISRQIFTAAAQVTSNRARILSCYTQMSPDLLIIDATLNNSTSPYAEYRAERNPVASGR